MRNTITGCTHAEDTETPVCEVTHTHPDIAARVRTDLPDENELCRLSEFFRVFGDPTRLKILLALDAAELCVCDISDSVGMSKSAVSHQLAALRAAHLVAYRREGKNIYYRLADNHVRHIIECALGHIRED